MTGRKNDRTQGSHQAGNLPPNCRLCGGGIEWQDDGTGRYRILEPGTDQEHHLHCPHPAWHVGTVLFMDGR